MKNLLALALVAFGGCSAPRQAYVFRDVPQASLDSVSVPQSPYANEARARWFAAGYREGWQRGSSGENPHPPPLSLGVPQPLHDAYHEGFDAGYEQGSEEVLEQLGQEPSLIQPGNREPGGAANGSQPSRSGPQRRN